MNNIKFSGGLKLLVSLLIFSGSVLVGLGIGRLTYNTGVGFLIGGGIGLLLISITLIMVELYIRENP